MTTIGQMMGDPGTDTELQEVRAAMRAERAKQERDLQAALNEDRATRRPPEFDLDKQARTMWRNGYSLGDIATIQKRSLGNVYAAVIDTEDMS